jgi:hypothetical protein
MDAINELLPAGFPALKTFAFGIVLCLGLKAGEVLTGALGNAVEAAQRKKR